MLDNVYPVQEVHGLARRKRRDYETKTVSQLLAEQSLAEGWSIQQKRKKSVRLQRKKPHHELLEDRVWSLLYRLGFTHMSGDGGGILLIGPDAPEHGAKTQIDVVGIDDEIAVAVECKSSEKPAKRPQFKEELGKHALIREKFSQAINSQFPGPSKRQVVLAMFLSNTILSDNDRTMAAEAKVLLFDEQDLAYYEELARHLGPAAKYQLLSDMLPEKAVPGLKIRVPAVRTKMGGHYCYTVSVSPEYLLKISYVSHRSKGKASDVNTYQRMVSKSRLNRIKEYISREGIFPTNIVLNLEKKRVAFERIHQETDLPKDQGLLGWLEMHPAYKSAWVIDGQHRLFAYSGHPKATKSLLSILAFEGLPPSKQAELFIDINSKQKAVRRSLLQELYAELHWDAKEPQVRVRAIISKAIQELDADPESPLYQRIQKADESRDPTRCITLTSIYSAIEKTGFYIVKEKGDQVLEFGPLWAGDNEATLERTVYVLNNWFLVIRESASDWWEKGSAPGGGLAMNDGVATCINVLRSVFQHLDSKGQKLIHLDKGDLSSCIKPYAEALGKHLASLSELDRQRFRDLRAAQGLMVRTRRCQAGIRSIIPSFNPPGLDEFLEQEKAQTNVKAKEVIDRIEKTLQGTVLNELKEEFGSNESEWWILGVPKQVRLDVTERFEKDDGKRGSKEYYFDLIDYKKIAVQNWELFEPLLAYGKKGNKEARLSWMVFVNEKRNIVAHSSSAMSLSFDDLSKLEGYETWLSGQIGGGEDMSEAVGKQDISQDQDEHADVSENQLA
ncbi:MAG: DGQHR domain-containing protein [Chloroflexota bacterium]